MIDEPYIDFSKIIKRLELIRNLIILEEESEIETQILKLEQLNFTIELEHILIQLRQKAYSGALIAIELFINQFRNLVIYRDPEINALKFETKSLEADINLLSEKIADIEKQIHGFEIRHNDELGELLIQILRHRKENSKGTIHEQEAEDDFNTYQKEYEATKDEKIAKLNDNEQIELKDKYRKASKLCHPDVVSEDQKEFATKIFADLSDAYENNNLKRVREILENLKKGQLFTSKSDAINEKVLLEVEIQNLRLKINELKLHLSELKKSEIYNTIEKIKNWDDYFRITKENLTTELNKIKSK